MRRGCNTLHESFTITQKTVIAMQTVSEIQAPDAKLQEQCRMFENRLSKRFRHLQKWAKRNGVFCFRLYDKDIPEIPLALDFYQVLPDTVHTAAEARAYAAKAQEVPKEQRYIKLYLYERPYQKAESEEELWLFHMKQSAAAVLGVPDSQIFCTIRKRQRGSGQYVKHEETPLRVRVLEHEQLFTLNLTSYLDTGLFFDLRPLRRHIKETCAGSRVLNLFCYTGSFSVYAAAGGAALADSVDLSNTYLAWAKENLAANGFSDADRYRCIKSDALQFLRNAVREHKRWDIIILDPPTFSNSHSGAALLDINRQWSELAALCISVLSAHGVLYFSTNSRRLVFDASLLSAAGNAEPLTIQDITERTIPEDFSGKHPHRCWRISRTDK